MDQSAISTCSCMRVKPSSPASMGPRTPGTLAIVPPLSRLPYHGRSMLRTTFAMVLTGPRRLEPRDLPLPDLGADEALLRVEACGICGSDYEQFEGVLRTPVPVIPGHEPLGRIAKIGDRAARRWGVEVGDRVAVENMISCRFCTPCLSGRSHLCEKRVIYSY